MKDVDNPAWNTHNNKDYCSKKFYKKMMASANPDEPPLKKAKPTVGLVTQ